MRQLPQYQCHKKVWALKIEKMDQLHKDGAWEITPEDKRYAPFMVTADWFSRTNARPGDYWVQYEDGYTSCSPAHAFESGYTLIDHRAPQTLKGVVVNNNLPGGQYTIGLPAGASIPVGQSVTVTVN